MKERVLVFACVSLLGLILIPAQLFADGSCTPPEYSNCGVPLSPVTFTITQISFPWAIVQADWYGYHASFTDRIYMYDITTGYSSDLSTFTNQQNPLRGTNELNINDIQGKKFHLGDQVEFVIRDYSDPNHPGGVDYCQFSSSCYHDVDNHNTPIGHVFAENLPYNQCDQSAPCAFLGFEDLPFKEGNNQNYQNDWDYNDFEIYVYGVSINGSQSSVPEPSSIVLLAGAPLAFLIRKLRNMV